jgi:hypothetical protein
MALGQKSDEGERPHFTTKGLGRREASSKHDILSTTLTILRTSGSLWSVLTKEPDWARLRALVAPSRSARQTAIDVKTTKHKTSVNEGFL